METENHSNSCVATTMEQSLHPYLAAQPYEQHQNVTENVMLPNAQIFPALRGVLPIPAFPSTNWRHTKEEKLSSISSGDLGIPKDSSGFIISEDLQHVLRNKEAHNQDTEELLKRLVEEANAYAKRRKELVRNKLKERAFRIRHSLTVIDKSKLRSRREARVHREKEKHFEHALKDAILWMISELL